MSIFSRLADIVNSNVGAILDRAEDPQKLVRLMIQEMEDTLIEVRSTAARILADRKDLERRLARARALGHDWQEKAELALRREREELARAALAEKNRAMRLAGEIEEEISALASVLERQEADIGRLEEKLHEARARQRSLQARMQSASQRVRVRRQLDDGRIEDALARFDDLERRVDHAEAEAEVYDLGRTQTLREEFAGLEDDAQVEHDLAALRDRLGTRAGG